MVSSKEATKTQEPEILEEAPVSLDQSTTPAVEPAEEAPVSAPGEAEEVKDLEEESGLAAPLDPAPAAPETPAPAKPKEAPLTNSQVVELHKSKAQKMKENLESQPKIRFFIPLAMGEKKGAYETVNLNGYGLKIAKGMYVDLPTQVADVLAESYGQTEQAGQEFLADRQKVDEHGISIQQALGG